MQAIVENENMEIAESNRPVDILNREDFVNRIMDLINTVSDSRGSYTFSLNGSWGVGKSFVLNMLEEQLLTYQAGEKYLVFHYNCWQYDYYEEPLFAIVAAMLEYMDKETHFFSPEFRNKATAAFEVVRPVLKQVMAEASKSMIGIDVTRLIGILKNEGKAFSDVIEYQEKEKAADDPYFSFTRTLGKVKEQLDTLAQDHTVVVIVDELDRCLPTYAIKVLERLHHLFYGVENCMVVVAVAEDQLDNTIKQVFGEKIATEQYLKKFIDFRMNLDAGEIKGSFSEKHKDYFSMFDQSLIDSNFDVDEFCAALFDSLNPRTQEHLMERIKTVHRILIPEEKKDYSVMCFEMLWIVLLHNGLTNDMPISMDGGKYHIAVRRNVSTSLTTFSDYIGEKWSGISMRHAHSWTGSHEAYVFDDPIDIPQLMLWYLCDMYPNKTIAYQLYTHTPRLEEYEENQKHFKHFNELLSIIQ